MRNVACHLWLDGSLSRRSEKNEGTLNTMSWKNSFGRGRRHETKDTECAPYHSSRADWSVKRRDVASGMRNSPHGPQLPHPAAIPRMLWRMTAVRHQKNLHHLGGCCGWRPDAEVAGLQTVRRPGTSETLAESMRSLILLVVQHDSPMVEAQPCPRLWE